MAEYTTNYSLRKPDPDTDFVNVNTDVNENMDTIDTELNRIDDFVHTITFARWSANETAVSDVYVSSAYGTLAVAAGKKYLVRAFLTLYAGGASSSAADVKIRFTYPAGELAISTIGPDVTDTVTANPSADIMSFRTSNQASPSADFPFGMTNAGIAPRCALFEGVLEATASGNLVVQFAQQVTNASHPTGIGIGSYLILERIQ